MHFFFFNLCHTTKPGGFSLKSMLGKNPLPKMMPRNSIATVFMYLRCCELWLAAFPKNNWCIHTPWEIYIPLHLGLYTIWFKWHRHWRKWTVKRTVFENKHKAKWFDILFHLKCKWWTFRAWFTTFLKAQMFFFLFGPLTQLPQIRRILCSIKKSPVVGWLLFVPILRNGPGSPQISFPASLFVFPSGVLTWNVAVLWILGWRLLEREEGVQGDAECEQPVAQGLIFAASCPGLTPFHAFNPGWITAPITRAVWESLNSLIPAVTDPGQHPAILMLLSGCPS